MKEKSILTSVENPIIEKINDTDQNTLQNARLKSELALERVRTALSQKENAEIAYNNLVLQIALKHHLSEGDVIDENGNIQRNS